ncbi:hypothetical protein ACIQ9E_23440 [Streptomyces sp. NPDC094448]|uniref:hypothetical protein n=1 Tax=Streptomyces sp. NPDC094448 TaxID=3366063 RepID=UPI00381ADF02
MPRRQPPGYRSPLRHRPGGIDESGGCRALAAWNTEATALGRVPLGFGDRHRTAETGGGEPWFVTVSDLAAKYYCVIGAASRPDPGALAPYRLRRSPEDPDDFLVRFRSPHTAEPGTEEAWQGFTDTVKDPGTQRP